MERNKRNGGEPAITIRLRFYMRSANASLELDDRFLAHVASCLSKTMGAKPAKAQVAFSRDLRLAPGANDEGGRVITDCRCAHR